MTHNQTGLPSHPLPLLSLLDIRRQIPSYEQMDQPPLNDAYSIWWIKQGFANVEIDGAKYTIAPGGCVLILPRSVVRLRSADSVAGILDAYDFRFTANETAEALIGRFPAVFSADSECISRFIDLLDGWAAVDGLARLRLHIRFQELAVLLLEQRESSSASGVEREVEKTIEYLQREFSKDIRIEKLAEQTALSRVKYNDIFRTMTGKTPVQYLTELRIDRAKQLLIGSDQRLKEIAEQTGFRDEYYFSRRFKQSVGLSPIQFVRLQSTDLRICSLHTLGDLLPLGVLPVGTNRSFADLYGEETRDIQSLEEPLDMDKLLALQPDLIVCPSYMPRQQYDRLAAIAPTALLDWHDHIYTRLNKLGRLLGKSYNVKVWIETYRNKAMHVRQALQPHLQKGESAAAFVYHRKGLYVYGSHNFGHTLYEGLGFNPPDKIRTLILKEKSLKWKKIAPEELPRYAGDRVFLAVEKTDRHSADFLKLLHGDAWRCLPAVQKNRSYIVDHRWGLYDALTLERHLDEMLALLTS